MTFRLFSWITDPEPGDYFASDTGIDGEDVAEVIATAPHRLLTEWAQW